jgi:hypothetical protein
MSTQVQAETVQLPRDLRAFFAEVEIESRSVRHKTPQELSHFWKTRGRVYFAVVRAIKEELLAGRKPEEIWYDWEKRGQMTMQ